MLTGTLQLVSGNQVINSLNGAGVVNLGSNQLTVANANKNRGVKHVFGIVADPFNAGVGVNPTNGAEPICHISQFIVSARL